MTEEVARRFATSDEAIKFALDHGHLRAEASYLTDAEYAAVERTRAAIAADAKSLELGKLGRQTAKAATVVARGEEIAALLAKPQPELEPVPPGRALVPVNHGGPIRFGRDKNFSAPLQPVVESEEVVSPAVEALLDEARSPLSEVAFAKEVPDYDEEPAVLSLSASYDNARTYARRRCFRDEALGVFNWHGKWWQWDNQTYDELPENQLHAYVAAFLDASRRKEGTEQQLVRFRPAPKHANDLIHFLADGLLLPAWAHPPMRLDTGERLGDVMMFANGLFNVRTGERMADPTAAYWIHAAVPYELRFDAACPEWLAFLERAFPGDPDAHAVVEEALGLSMNEDRSFQKGMMLVGEPRSGKGTILAVLEGLLGSGNFIGVDLNKWMEGENSRAGLISKRAIVFADVRLKPEKRYGTNLDPGGLDHKSIALLLHIIAGDTVSINVKYQIQPWQGRLPGLVWLASNKVPNFNDLVLPTRFIKLSFKESYLGREDNELVEKLLRELPGIAARCVRAYDRLRWRGRFIQPASSGQLEIDIRKTSDPFTQFVLDTFVPDPKGQVTVAVAYAWFEQWCGEHGHLDLPKSIINKNLKTYIQKVPGFENIETFKPHGEPRNWRGIRLRKGRE